MAEDSFDAVENELNKGALWGVVYGDFMSYMMIFFLVLFSFSLRAQQGGQAPTLAESLQGIQKDFGGRMSQEMLERLTQRRQEDGAGEALRRLIAEQGLADQARVEVTQTRVKVVLTAPVLFDVGRAELKPDALPILEGVSRTLAALNKEVVVEGHTDSQPVMGGPYASNWDLSAARATAVVRLLLGHGVPAERLTAAGYGEHRPVAANDAPDGRALNRRIEISLIR